MKRVALATTLTLVLAGCQAETTTTPATTPVATPPPADTAAKPAKGAKTPQSGTVSANKPID